MAFKAPTSSDMGTPGAARGVGLAMVIRLSFGWMA